MLEVLSTGAVQLGHRSRARDQRQHGAQPRPERPDQARRALQARGARRRRTRRDHQSQRPVLMGAPVDDREARLLRTVAENTPVVLWAMDSHGRLHVLDRQGARAAGCCRRGVGRAQPPGCTPAERGHVSKPAAGTAG